MKKVSIAVLIVAAVIASLIVFGKKHISTDIVIDAPANRVWKTLTDFKRYPQWNPFIRNASGAIREGATIEITLQTKGGDPISFSPRVLQFKENEKLQWEGRLIMPGIFTGQHTFTLSAIDSTRTRLVQEENFSGILVPFINLDPTLDGFKSMNAELKKVTEKSLEE